MRLIHLLAVLAKQRPEEAAAMMRLSPDLDTQRWAAQKFLTPGVKFTVLDADRKPVACFGVDDELPGVGTAWLVMTPESERHVKTAARAFSMIAKNGCYRRIQAFIEKDNAMLARWMKFLRFKFEAPCAKLAPNGDTMLLYAIT